MYDRPEPIKVCGGGSVGGTGGMNNRPGSIGGILFQALPSCIFQASSSNPERLPSGTRCGGREVMDCECGVRASGGDRMPGMNSVGVR